MMMTNTLSHSLSGAHVGPMILAVLFLSSCRHDPQAGAPAPIFGAAASVAATPIVSPLMVDTASQRAAVVATAEPQPARAAGSPVAPVYTPEEELARFRLPDGYRMELVAAEPLVQDPIAIDFDADGRMYVVEMRGYMPNLQGTGEDRPIGRIVVVEDTNGDGRMDRTTVFMDSLVLPRAIKVTEHGVFVGAPPNLWLVRDTNGDLQADTRELIRSDYGDPKGNPEHNANGLAWGIDNWIHNANYGGQLRVGADGKVLFRTSANEGQWGVAADERGRLYRNSNEDPLRADLIPSHYAMRNANLATLRGIYEQLTPNVAVWPAHKTPAVNRGYRAETMRPDSTLAHYTSAGSPTPFVGDRLPAELRNSVFVTESAGNMVGRFVIEETDNGTPVARTAYDHAEFLTASDERFRPVNLANAPDGTLYVVDMYRGIIQHRAFITGYLEQKIVERGLSEPIGLGRVWRVVHASTPRGDTPRLSRKTTAELVPLLAHPNGWWRITAQRLLVERGDHAAAPALRQMARTHPDDRARLHALWTLDGIGDADESSIRAGLADSSPAVRASALRIAEPWFEREGNALASAVMPLMNDRSALVRRQHAASAGALLPRARDTALLAVIARNGDDPVVTDLVVSAVAGAELSYLQRILAVNSMDSVHYASVIRSLSRALTASRDAVRMQALLALAGAPSSPRWQRLAILDGIRNPAGQRGGFVIDLPTRPQTLVAAMTSADTALRARATVVAESLRWPGKQATGPAVRPLMPDEQKRFAVGRVQYLASCAGCHQANGRGLPGLAKPLVGSRWVLGVPEALVRIVLHGKEGEMLMPPVGSALSSDQVASVLTYIRRSWGNTASAIAPAQVNEVRGATTGRSKPWTDAELARIRR